MGRPEPGAACSPRQSSCVISAGQQLSLNCPSAAPGVAQSSNFQRLSWNACAIRGWSVGRKITKDSRQQPPVSCCRSHFNNDNGNLRKTQRPCAGCPAAWLPVCRSASPQPSQAKAEPWVGGIKPSISSLNSAMLVAVGLYSSPETHIPPPHCWAVSLRGVCDAAVYWSIQPKLLRRNHRLALLEHLSLHDTGAALAWV